MTNIILNGCNGKMGQFITEIVKGDHDCNICFGIDALNQTSVVYPVYATPSDVDYNGEKDVIIDFSHPSCLVGLLEYCKKNNIPIVVATTGLTAEQIELIKTTAEEIPIFYSANMSVGIALIKDLAVQAAKFLGDDFDIEIIEKHHNQKIDAPSGTALALADAVKGAFDSPMEYVYDRHAVRKKRSKSEIGIHAVRGGTIVGDHSVIYAGNNEVIEINHSATSKEVFAVGAVRAAKFISTVNKPGIYDMSDLIKSFSE